MKKKIMISILVILFLLSGCIENENENNDKDHDGVIDNKDEFPDDPNEWKDSDNDGIGDNKDIYDNGNGGIKFTLLSFECDGSVDTDDYGIPDPYFNINIGYLDSQSSNFKTLFFEGTDIFYDTAKLIRPFVKTVDIDDDISIFSIDISVDDFDSGGGDKIDISSNISKKTIRKYVSLSDQPYQKFTFDGRDDGRVDELDGIIEVSIEVVKI